jgi:hypothetical protein
MIFVATKIGRTNNFFPLLLFWCCCWTRDPRCIKIRIQDPGSATLGPKSSVSDPHWSQCGSGSCKLPQCGSGSGLCYHTGNSSYTRLSFVHILYRLKINFLRSNTYISVGAKICLKCKGLESVQ